MALRLVKEWIYNNSYNTESSFENFVLLAKGKKSQTEMLT